MNELSIHSTLTGLREELAAGNFELVQKKIKSWLKKNSPNPKERILLSEYTTWMGQEEQSLKILGPLLAPPELESVTPEELAIQMRLSYVLGMMGAVYVSRRQFQRLAQQCQERKLVLEQLYPQYFQNRGYLAISTYRYKEAQDFFEKAIALYSPPAYQWVYSTLGLADSLCGQDRFAEARSRATSILSMELPKNLRASVLQALGEYTNLSGDHHEAAELLKDGLEEFERIEGNLQTKDYAYALKHWGLNRAFLGHKAEGIQALMKAKDLLERLDQTPNSLTEILFWIEGLDPSLLRFEEALTLRCFPTYSLYGRLVGRIPSTLDGTHLPKWLGQFERSEPGDSWLLEGQTIRSIHYNEYKNSGTCLDLMSSCLFKDEKPEALSPLQASLLLCLLGAGSRGCHELLLLDRSYREDFIDTSIALDKLKKAVRELRKLGFSIDRTQSTYRLSEFPSAYQHIIIPKTLVCAPQYPWIKKLHPEEIETKTVAGLFNVHQRTAQRWVQEWVDRGVLVKNQSTYCWIDRS
jgi:tetratricopeptide (TPR) repeat protein